MTFNELHKAVAAILPGATIEEDLEGQLIIYTNLNQKGLDMNETKEEVFTSIHCSNDGEICSCYCSESKLTKEQYDRICEGEKPLDVVPEQFDRKD